MKILDRYISRRVISGSMLVLLMLVSVNLVFTLGAEIGSLGKGNYDLSKALIYTIATAPRRMYDYMPMACIIGTLLQVGVLANDSELIVMQSSGISKKHIIFFALKGGMYVVALSFILSEVVIPVSEPYAQQLRTFSINQSSALRGAGGIWVREGNIFMNIKKLLPDTTLRDITILEFNAGMELKVLSLAKEAKFTKAGWILAEVNTATLNPEDIRIEKIDTAKFSALLSPEIINALAIKPEQQSLIKLSTYIKYLQSNNLNITPYRFAYWKRLVSPFAILAMIILAFPLLFGSLRSTSMGLRITIGILIGFTYLILSKLLSNLGAVYDYGPVLSNVSPLIILFFIGFLLTKYSERH